MRNTGREPRTFGSVREQAVSKVITEYAAENERFETQEYRCITRQVSAAFQVFLDHRCVVYMLTMYHGAPVFTICTTPYTHTILQRAFRALGEIDEAFFNISPGTGHVDMGGIK